MIPVLRVRDENGNVKDVVAVAAPAIPAAHASKHAADGSDPITPEAIGAAAADHNHDNAYAQVEMHQLRTYTSLSQIDLSGEVTMEQVCEAMPLDSMLVISNNKVQTTSYVSDVPHDYGMITVIRAEENYCVATYARSDGLSLAYYIGKYHHFSDGWTGWKRMADTDYAVNKAGDTMTGNLTVERAYATVKAKDTTSNRSVRIISNPSGTVALHSYKDDSNYAGIVVNPEKSDLSKILRLQENNAGTVNFFDILHTGNMEALGVGRVATGSYVGTGNNGANYPNSISFDFVPKVVFITTISGASVPSCNVFSVAHISNSYESIAYIDGSGYGRSVMAKIVDNTLYWYNTTNYALQLNAGGQTYEYLGIG